MKERIAGVIAFLVGLSGLCFGLFSLINDLYSFLRSCILVGFKITVAGLGHYHGNLEASFFLITISTPIVLYILWTKFGKKGLSDLERLDYENQILKKQLEQKKLKEEIEQ